MMRQSSLTGFEKYARKTRKEQFLEEMWRIGQKFPPDYTPVSQLAGA